MYSVVRCRLAMGHASRLRSRPSGRNIVLIGVRRRLFFSKKAPPPSELAPGETALATNNLRPRTGSKYAWLLLGLSVWGGYKSVQLVETGQVGVVEVLGVVQENLLQPGVHTVVPWASTMIYNLRPQQISVPTQTRIRGGLFVDLELAVTGRLDPTKIKEIYTTQGKHPKDPFIEAITRSVLHSVVAKKTMEQMHDTQQLAICQEIQTQLNGIFQPKGIIIEQVVFTKVQLPDYLVTAIQELHQLDLEISADKRIVDGKLAVARGTAAARSVLKEEDEQKKAVVLFNAGVSEGQNRAKLAEKGKTVKQPQDTKDKTLLESYFPYFFGGDDKNKVGKKVTVKVFPLSFFAEKEKGQDSSGADDDAKESIPSELSEASSGENDRVEEAKVPVLKAADNNKSMEQPPQPKVDEKQPQEFNNNASTTEPPLQETATNKAAKAAAEAEKES